MSNIKNWAQNRKKRNDEVETGEKYGTITSEYVTNPEKPAQSSLRAWASNRTANKEQEKYDTNSFYDTMLYGANKSTNDALNNVLNGWQDSKTMDATKEMVTNAMSNLEGYQNRSSYSQGLYNAYKNALDNWDSISSAYGAFKTKDAFDSAKYTSDMSSANKGLSYAEVKAKRDAATTEQEQDFWKNYGINTGYNSIADYDEDVAEQADNKELKEKRNQYELENRFQKYAGLMNNEDFAEKSQYSASDNGQANTGSIYNLINGTVSYDLGQAIKEGVEYFTAPTDVMTDDEKAVYNYLYRTDREAADAYYKDMKTTWDKRNSQWTKDIYNDVLNNDTLQALSFLNPALGLPLQIAGAINPEITTDVQASMASIPLNMVGGLTSTVGDLIDTVKGNEVNPYNSWHAMGNVATDVRNEVSNDIGNPLGSFLYQTGMSMADSTVGVLSMGRAFAPVMGTNAYSQKLRELKDQGVDDEEAFSVALGAGIAETLFEYLSIDKLVKMGSVGNVSDLVKSALKQGGIEASEEVFTELANILTDSVLRGDTSEVSKEYDSYIAQGYTPQQASMKTFWSKAGDVGLAAAGGFISGGVMGAGFGAFNYNQNKQTGANININGGTEALTDIVNRLGDKSEAYKAQQRYNAKGSMTDAETGAVYQLAQEQVAQNQNKAPKELQKQSKEVNKQSDNYKRLLVANKLKESYSNMSGDEALDYADKILKGEIHMPENIAGDIARIAEDVGVYNHYGTSDERNAWYTNGLKDFAQNSKAVKDYNETFTKAIDSRVQANTLNKIAATPTEEAKESYSNRRNEEQRHADEIKDRTSEMKTNAASTATISDIDFDNGTITTSEGTKGATNDVSVNPQVAEVIAEGEIMAESDPVGAKTYVKNYNAEQNVQAYTTAYNMLKSYAEAGFSTDYVTSNQSLMKTLTPTQVKNIYTEITANRVKSAQANLDSVVKNVRKGVKKSTFNDSIIDYNSKTTDGSRVNYNDLNNNQKLTVAMVGEISKALGINVELFSSKNGNNKANGYYNAATNTIGLDIYSGTATNAIDGYLLITMSHELTHWMETKSPEAYDKLKDYILQRAIKNTGLNEGEYVQREFNRLKNAHKGVDYTEADAIHEIVARGCEDMLTKSDVIRPFLNNLSEHERSGFVAKVKELFNKIKSAIQNLLHGLKSNTPEAQNLRRLEGRCDEAIKLWDNALKASMKFNDRVNRGAAPVEAELSDNLNNVDLKEREAYKSKDKNQFSDKAESTEYTEQEMKDTIREAERIRLSTLSREELESLKNKLHEMRWSYAKSSGYNDIPFSKQYYSKHHYLLSKFDDTINYLSSEIFDIKRRESAENTKKLERYAKYSPTPAEMTSKSRLGLDPVKDAEKIRNGLDTMLDKLEAISGLKVDYDQSRKSANTYLKFYSEDMQPIHEIRIADHINNEGHTYEYRIKMQNRLWSSVKKEITDIVKSWDRNDRTLLEDRDKTSWSYSDKANENDQLFSDETEYRKQLLIHEANVFQKVLDAAQIKQISKAKCLAIARHLNKKYSTNYDNAKAANMLYSLYESFVDYDGPATDILDAMLPIADLFAKEAYKKVKIRNTGKELYNELRKTAFSLTDVQKQEARNKFGKNFNRNLMGKVSYKADAPTLESQWNELAEVYQGYINPDVQEGEQLEALLTALDTLKQESAADERETYNIVKRDVTQREKYNIAADIFHDFYNAAIYDAVKTLQKGTKDEAPDGMDIANNEIAAANQRANEAEAKYNEQVRKNDELNENLRNLIKSHKEIRQQYEEAMNKESAKSDKDIAKEQRDYAKKLKEQYANQVKGIKEEYKTKEAGRRLEAEKRTEIDRITSIALRLNDYLKQNSAKKHIPEFVKKPLAVFLNQIDFGNSNTKKGQEIRAAFDNLADMVSKVEIRTITTDESSEMYEDLPDFYEGFSRDVQAVRGVVNTIIDRHNGTFDVKNMSLEELKELKTMLSVFRTCIYNINNTLGLKQQMHISDLCNDSYNEWAKYGKLNQKFKAEKVADSFINYDNAQPIRVFERLGKSATLLFNGLQNGQDQLAYKVEEIADFMHDVVSENQINDWGKHVNTFEFGDKVITLTDAQLMSLYCLNNREQAQTHIYGGGIVATAIKNGIGKEIPQSEATTVTPDEVTTMLNSLTAEHKEVCNEIQAYMSSVLSDWGNKVTMQRFGFKGFAEKNYFPIKSDSDFIRGDQTKMMEQSLYRLLNMGFTKATQKGANNALYVDNIFDVFATHASDMAKYSAVALPLLDLVRWYDHVEKVGDNGEAISTKKALRKAFGSQAQEYVTKLAKDLNSTTEEADRGNVLRSLFRNAKIAAVGFNLRVAMLQGTSYFRAMTEIEPKYMAEALKKKPAIKKCQENSGIAKWKQLGFYDMNISKGMTHIIKGDDTTIDKINEKSMWMASKADEITWGILWNACEAKVSDTTDLTYDSKEYLEKVNEEFTNMIYKTQVVDSILTRSQVMRGKSMWTQGITAFMSEPTVSLNILTSVASEWTKDARENAKYNKKGQRVLDYSHGVAKYGKQLAKAAAVYTITNAAAAVIEALADAARKREKDEEFGTKYIEKLISNFEQDMSLIGKIPILKDVQSIMQGYSSGGSLEEQFIETGYKAIQQWKKFGDGKAGNENLYKAIYQTLQTASQTTGLPMANAMRDLVAIWNTTIAMAYPSLFVG